MPLKKGGDRGEKKEEKNNNVVLQNNQQEQLEKGWETVQMAQVFFSF